MSSCITRSEAVWFSGNSQSREPLDEAVYSAIGNNSEENSKEINGLPKAISKIVVDYLEEYPCFGEKEWTRLCGRVDPAPLLPHGFSAIWNRSCPIFPEKTIGESHVLVYIPTTVDGEPFTLKKLLEIAKRVLTLNEKGFPTNGFWPKMMEELGDKSIEKSRWVLMTKEAIPGSIVPGSINISYAHHQKMVADLAIDSLSYEIPETLEAVTCILVQYFSDSKTPIFGSYNYTICKEKIENFQICAGSSDPFFGMYVGRYDYNAISYTRPPGVAVLQRF